MVVQEARITINDFQAWLDARAAEGDDRHYELIDGEVVAKVPTEEHGAICVKLIMLLGMFNETHKLGRLTTEARHRASADDALNDRIPDIAFTRSERLLPITTQGAVPQMPDLAVEIMSPSNTLKTMRAKAEYYLAHGTSLVWIVITNKRLIDVHTPDSSDILTIDEALDGGVLLPGLSIPVRAVFEVA